MKLFGEARTENVSDAVRLLVIDHQKVERIFAELERSSTVAERQSLCAQLDAELSRHTAIEERVLYPFVRTSISDGPKLIDDAVAEHDEARRLLDQVVTTDPGTGAFTAAIERLQNAVDHHVQEEEAGLFPKLEAEASPDALREMRRELEAAKAEEHQAPNLPGRQPRPARSSSGRSSGPASRRHDGASVWVQPHHTQDGRWQVRRDKATRASRVFDTQAEAETFGRRVAKRERVEFVLAGRDGTIREKDSYGNDPRSSPG
jgi:iron-sulfur cluster repair protein YtfE (RIC family)